MIQKQNFKKGSQIFKDRSFDPASAIFYHQVVLFW